MCDSLGMRFSEELNSHNCSFVVCATPSGAEGDAALAITGDKMTQVLPIQLAVALIFVLTRWAGGEEADTVCAAQVSSRF